MPTDARTIAILERNLERLPWATTGDHPQLSLELPFPVHQSSREWRVYHKEGGRLPGPFDADVYIAVCHLYNHARRPAHRKVIARFIDMARLMGRPAGGTFYRAVEDSIHRLTATTIECENVWRGKTGLKSGRVTAHIFDKAETVHRAENPSDGTIMAVTIGEDLAASIAGGHFRLLDAGAYFSLGQRGVTKRLYRYLDYRRWVGGDRLDERTFTLDELRRDVPIDRIHPSHILRSLLPAHNDLIAANFLAAVHVVPEAVPDRKRPVLHVHYEFPQLALPEPYVEEEEDPNYLKRAVGGIIEVLRDNHSTAFYASVAKALPADVLSNVLGGVKEDLQRGISLQAARRLFTRTAKTRAALFGIDLAVAR